MQHIILSPVCSAIDNKPCIFPLTYNGKTYNECISKTPAGANTRAWCATEVSDGKYKTWNYCKEVCNQGSFSYQLQAYCFEFLKKRSKKKLKEN